jgi:pyrroline-5-carboxylate reductase
MNLPEQNLTHFAGAKIAVVGAGNMAEALVKGLIQAEGIDATNIVVSARRVARAERLASKYSVTASPDNASCVRDAAIVLLAVKPQVMSGVLAGLRPHISKDALVLSVAAGITTSTIESLLEPGVRVVRAMPNTPAMIGMSATAIAPGANATDADMESARVVFAAVGRVVLVDEVHLDAVTGLSGSGPAYIFLIMEALADAGVKVGLSREIALELAAQTLLGSAQMLLQTGEHPGRLKDQVTSPGGTAIAGLHTLEEGGLRTTLINAVEAATRRAKELGDARK